MGRLTVVNFISLDGVVQSPLSADEDDDGGFAQGGWVPPYSDETVDRFMTDATVGAAAMLLGRRSYEILVAAWSGADEAEPAVAAMNRMPKHVVTSSGDGLDWQNTHQVAGPLDESVPRLVAGTDGDLVVLGSAALTGALARLDLVDRYQLLLFPVLLGDGKRMFEGARPARFDLTDAVVSSSGVAVHTYDRRRSD